MLVYIKETLLNTLWFIYVQLRERDFDKISLTFKNSIEIEFPISLISNVRIDRKEYSILEFLNIQCVINFPTNSQGLPSGAPLLLAHPHDE